MSIISPANYLLHGAHKSSPHTPWGANDDPNGVAAGAAERMRTRIDAIATDTMTRVDAHVQRKQRHDHARQRARRRYHENDYHLQSCCLVYVGAAQNRARHHTRDGNEAHHAAIYGGEPRGRSGQNAKVVYLIWLMVGVIARRRASIASGRQASKRDAPNARSVSVLS
jgi:hypothetical protein